MLLQCMNLCAVELERAALAVAAVRATHTWAEVVPERCEPTLAVAMMREMTSPSKRLRC